MTHAPQIRMLKAVCCAIDDILDDHDHGEFIEAGLKVGREVACRASEKLKDHDKAIAQQLVDADGGSKVTFDPKGKASKRV